MRIPQSCIAADASLGTACTNAAMGPLPSFGCG